MTEPMEYICRVNAMEIATDFFCLPDKDTVSINGVSEEIRRRTGVNLTAGYPSATNMMNQSRETTLIELLIDEYYSAFRGQTADADLTQAIVTLTACMNAENGLNNILEESVGSAMRNDYDEEVIGTDGWPKRICVAFTYYLYDKGYVIGLSSAISILAGFSMYDIFPSLAVYNMMDNLLIVLLDKKTNDPYEDNLQWHIKAQRDYPAEYKLSAILYTELGLHKLDIPGLVDAMVLFRSLRVHEGQRPSYLTKAPSQQWHVLYCTASFYCKYRRLWFKEDQANKKTESKSTLQKEGIDPLGVFNHPDVPERLPDLLVAWNHQFDISRMLETYTCATAGQCIVRMFEEIHPKKTGEKVTKTKDIISGYKIFEVILKKAQELLSKIEFDEKDDEIHFFGAKNYMDRIGKNAEVETNEMDGTKEPWIVSFILDQKYLKRWPNNISPNRLCVYDRVCTSPYVYWADLPITSWIKAKTLQMGLGARFPDPKKNLRKKEFEEKGKCQELWTTDAQMRENLKRPVYVTREEYRNHQEVLIKEVIHTKDGRLIPRLVMIAKECKHVAYATDEEKENDFRHHI
ncbi:hypothetical protein SPFM10_00246 [Salmonella phage SPFM10]|nr:hypothetical protein SPFM10_00246 [Salmonella phage SPFM10]